MAQFNISTFNHTEGGASSLEDPRRALIGALQALGHQVQISDYVLLAPPVINLVFEGWNGEALTQLKNAHDAGLILVQIATEQPTLARRDWTWNHNPPDGDDFQRSMFARCRVFPKSCAYTDAVFPLIPGTARWYRHHHDNVHEIELGFSPLTMDPESDVEPEDDWSFYGTMTPWRHDVIEAIGNAGMTVRVAQGLLPLNERDAMVRKCKGVLHIKQQRNWQILSSARCQVALSRRRLVYATDPVGAIDHVSSPYRDIIAMCHTHDKEIMIEGARACVAEWKALRDSQVHLFRRVLTPERCLGNALRASRIMEFAYA